jgi:peroxiredoxin
MKRSIFLLMAGIVLSFAFQAYSQTDPDTRKQDLVIKELKELEDRSAATAPPEVIKAGNDGAARIRESGILESALNKGGQISQFSLKDAYGKTVSSESLLKEGPVVLVFYRGAWCPYCNLYLRGLQRRLPDITSRGAKLVAVSVEPPDRSLEVLKNNKLEYTVLSDPDLKVAREFGIVYEVPKPVDDVIKSFGLDLAKYNGTEKAELPLGATYVIGRSGRVEYAFLEADYKKRADPEVILAVLDKLK